MKKIAVLVGVALLLLLGVAAASADPGRPHRHLRGEVVSIDASASTVIFLARDETTKTLTVVEATKILKNGHRATFNHLALGDRGNARYVRTDAGDLKALKIIVRTPVARGKISEITSDTITLITRPKLWPKLKVSRIFKVDEKTKISRNGSEVALADLKVRDQAKIYYNKTESGEFLAKRIKAAGKTD